MTTKNMDGLADDPQAIAQVYEDVAVADAYLANRLKFSWQRLLHRKQVAALNDALATYTPKNVLEVAPGPARLAPELRGVQRGTMVENSQQMLAIAKARLHRSSLSNVWDVRSGDAFALNAVLQGQVFDFAYTFRFIRHFREAERDQLYEQLRDCLSPGGLLMFDVVNDEMRARIDAKATPSKDEISIYDVTYSADGFAAEMRKAGFETLWLRPILRHFDLQSRISYRFEHSLSSLASLAVQMLELAPSRAPLEWVALCRRL